jgi:hypothetical protein
MKRKFISGKGVDQSEHGRTVNERYRAKKANLTIVPIRGGTHLKASPHRFGQRTENTPSSAHSWRDNR